jgi:hypothetical protein
MQSPVWGIFKKKLPHVRNITTRITETNDEELSESQLREEAR